MTDYDVAEASAHEGRPVEGYKFEGPVTYRYTSAELAVDINGETYTPVAITRGNIRTGTQEDDQNDLELSLPADLALVQDQAFTTPPPSLLLTVYRYHEGTDPSADWVIIWKGQVTSFSVTDGLARMRVPSIFALTLATTIPNRSFQGPCNHVLYDARCKVVRNSFKTTTTVASITDTTHFVVADDGAIDSYLRAGEIVIVSTGERRQIVDNVANTITIVYPFYNLNAGDSVDLVAGCAHTFAVCNSKFSNTVNFGGVPFLPSDNPFVGSF